MIRRHLDIVTFNKGDEKTVISDRHKTGDAAKLAVYG